MKAPYELARFVDHGSVIMATRGNASGGSAEASMPTEYNTHSSTDGDKPVDGETVGDSD